VTVSGFASCRDRDSPRVVSAIACFVGEIDDRLAWLSDCCSSNTSEGGAGLLLQRGERRTLANKISIYQRDTGIEDQTSTETVVSLTRELHSIFQFEFRSVCRLICVYVLNECVCRVLWLSQSSRPRRQPAERRTNIYNSNARLRSLSMLKQ
jgi:hypothetical protein